MNFFEKVKRNIGIVLIFLGVYGCDNYSDDVDAALAIDSDNDGVVDYLDLFPNDATESEDADGDRVGDNSDNCRNTPNPSQADEDGDSYGDACDFVAIATGLNSPRGLTCSDTGGLFVALSGAGAGDTPAGPEGLPSASSYLGADGRAYQYGLTGEVVHLDGNGQMTVILDGLPSLAHLANVEPRVWVDAAGPVDILEQSNGSLLVAIGLASDACLTREGLGEPSATMLGTVIDDVGNIQADLAAYECANNSDQRLGPDGMSDFTSNPWRMIKDAASDALLVVDSGANAVIRIDDLEAGALSPYETSLPDQLQEVPDWGLENIIGLGQTAIGLPPAGAVIPAQPVPTGIAIKESSGKVFLAELTGVPILAGSARVYEIPGAAIAFEGFTAITDIAFGSDEQLLVLEYSSDGMLGVLGLSSAEGRLAMLDPDGSVVDFSDRVALKHPTGLSVCDDTLYVANKGSVAGSGEILSASLRGLTDNR